jgi:hypothetical protein
MQKTFSPHPMTSTNAYASTQTVLFPHTSGKSIVLKLDQEHSRSDGGGLVIRALDDELGLTSALANAFRDSRQQGKVQHALIDLVRQRVYGLALGYPDCNDANALRDNSIHKLLIGRDPSDGSGRYCRKLWTTG